MSNIGMTIENIVKSLQQQNDKLDLKLIFTNPTVMNTIFKNKDIFKLFVSYIIITHNKIILNDKEFINYYRQLLPEDNMIDDYYFYNGEYTNCNLKNLNKNQINEILLLNTKKTQDEYFNKIFNMVKDYDIFEYDFPFNDIYLNARQQDYKFGFLKEFYQPPEEKEFSNIIKHLEEDDNILIYDESFGNAFILPYNYNNPAFKRGFYYLCSKHLVDNQINAGYLLNAFVNYESIFCSKNVIHNERDNTLITYIYFKGKDEKGNDVYIPNLRYTIDIQGDTHEDKRLWLDECCNESIVDKIKPTDILITDIKSIGFNTKVISDDKGYYFNTSEYDLKTILKNIDNYIKYCKFDEMLYYIFNSQFLSRSTCLFGYYIYFVFTGKIPEEKRYYDIIALTESFEEFKKKLKFKSYSYTYKTKNITLNKLIDYILSSY